MTKVKMIALLVIAVSSAANAQAYVQRVSVDMIWSGRGLKPAPKAFDGIFRSPTDCVPDSADPAWDASDSLLGYTCHRERGS
jgi:hypothetical protein